jgi:hypothetical protein
MSFTDRIKVPAFYIRFHRPPPEIVHAGDGSRPCRSMASF